MDPKAQELILRLRKNPSDSKAFEALRAHYQGLGDFPSLANLLEGWAARCPDGQAAADAFYEAGEAALGGGFRERAVGLFYRTLERSPVHAHGSKRLEQLFQQSGDGERLIDILERRAGALAAARTDDRIVGAVHQQLGELLQHRFGRMERATFHYRKAFELDPTLVVAIYSAREIYKTAGNYRAATACCELEAKAERDPERKLALWRESAQMCMHELNDFSGAISALEHALADVPDELSLQHELATAYGARAASGKHAATVAEDQHRAAGLFVSMAGRVPPEHALAYAEAALDTAPSSNAAMDLLERLSHEMNQSHLLPMRWVSYLEVAPDGPRVSRVRFSLGQAYIEAEQNEDAIVCLEPLLKEKHPGAAELLVTLYRDEQREDDLLRALAVAIEGLPLEDRIERLREIIPMLVAQGQRDAASAYASQILEIDPADAEALAFLEADLRAKRDFEGLRALLLQASRVKGASPPARAARLREVAELCLEKLKDLDGAIDALKGLVALEPTDLATRKSLRDLLQQTGRWDDLASVIEQDAHLVADPDEKAELYRHLAEIHRGARGDVQAAITALRCLTELKPDDKEAQGDLCTLLIEGGAYLEAVPLLRQQAQGAESPHEKLRHLRLLAETLQKHIEDDEGAFEIATQILDLAPKDLGAVGLMEQIDMRTGQHDRLLQTLSYRAEISAPPDKANALARMGAIAYEHLADLDRAAEYFSQALDLAPSDSDVLDTLCKIYEESERYKDLVVLLRDRAKLADDPKTHAELYRRIARVLSERVGNSEGAAEAWNEVLSSGEDEEALRFLSERAKKEATAEQQIELLSRLTDVVASARDKADLVVERASILAGQLERQTDAIVALREVVDTIAPDHLAAMELLAGISESVSDHDAAAHALESQLRLTKEADKRASIAHRLSDLYERELNDPARAIDRLYSWAANDTSRPEPHRRLVPLLEDANRWKDVLGSLDALAARETEDVRIAEATRRAAEIAYERLEDAQGAWDRLVPLVKTGDPTAREDLRSICAKAGRASALAEFYLSLAQADQAPDRQRDHWIQAAEIFEKDVHEDEHALEAMLRALAIDTDHEPSLDAVDRMAAQAGVWARLAQVYDGLLRRSDNDEKKVRLLMRHADLLDREGLDPTGALDRVLRACALAPADDDILAHAERLAPQVDRIEELLIVYDRRRAHQDTDRERVETLMRAVRQCDLGLKNRDRAIEYLSQAVKATVDSPELQEHIEATLEELEDWRPDLGSNSARKALVAIYRQVADEIQDEPEKAGQMLHRAAIVLETQLDDRESAYAAMKTAAGYCPADDRLLNELEGLAERVGRFEDLDGHYAALIREAIDSTVASELLRRRGRLLEEELGRLKDAAEVYRQLLSIDPLDQDAPIRLRSCLKAAGRFQDLLLVLEQEIEKTTNTQHKVECLKEVARTWEDELKNRWEALDAWNRALAVDPDDADATDAVKRLGHSTRRINEDAIVDVQEHLAVSRDAAGDEEGDELGGETEEESHKPSVPGSSDLFDISGDHTDPAVEEPPEHEQPLEDEPSAILMPVPTHAGEELPAQLNQTQPETPVNVKRAEVFADGLDISSDIDIDPDDFGQDTPIAIEPDGVEEEADGIHDVVPTAGDSPPNTDEVDLSMLDELVSETKPAEPSTKELDEQEPLSDSLDDILDDVSNVIELDLDSEDAEDESLTARSDSVPLESQDLVIGPDPSADSTRSDPFDRDVTSNEIEIPSAEIELVTGDIEIEVDDASESLPLGSTEIEFIDDPDGGPTERD